MTQSSKPESVKLTTAVVPITVAMLALGTILFIVIVAIKFGFPNGWKQLCRRIVSLVIVTPLFAWFLSIVFPYTLSPDGLEAYSFWGGRRFIRWSDIDDVRVFWFLNLKYVRLRSHAGKTSVWMTLSVNQPERFRELIRQYAGSESPLAHLIH